MENSAMNGLSLEDLLPHRGTMMLVSEILEVDRQHALTLCRVDARWPAAEARGVPSLLLVELAAQTAGVCNGWDRIMTRGIDSDPSGWLVGVKKAEFFIDWLPLGARIIARAENIHVYENLREVACELRLHDTLIGRIVLQLFQA